MQLIHVCCIPKRQMTCQMSDVINSTDTNYIATRTNKNQTDKHYGMVTTRQMSAVQTTRLACSLHSLANHGRVSANVIWHHKLCCTDAANSYMLYSKETDDMSDVINSTDTN